MAEGEQNERLSGKTIAKTVLRKFTGPTVIQTFHVHTWCWMMTRRRDVEDALEILLYLRLVKYDQNTGRYFATDKAMALEDEQLEEMLEKALGPRFRQTRLVDDRGG